MKYISSYQPTPVSPNLGRPRIANKLNSRYHIPVPIIIEKIWLIILDNPGLLFLIILSF